VKKFNYYAVPNAWHSSKWLGVVLGGFFGIIAVGTLVIIVQIVRGAHPNALAAGVAAAPAVEPVPATAPMPSPAAAAAPPAAKAAAPTAVATATAPEPVAEEAAPAHGHHHRHHHSASHKSSRVAKASPTSDQKKRQTVLAKHDSKEKRHEKDAIDKLLGL
jgi:hypothetical protein